MRTATIHRQTTETQIDLTLTLEGSGQYQIQTGVGFFDHMLEQFCRHGFFDLTLRCQGDLQVDAHHTVEDVGLALGQAFAEALGDKRGIARYGNFLLPMDEALVLVAVDLSGRPYLGYDLQPRLSRLGNFETQLVEEFLLGLSRALGATLHLKQLAGHNDHHLIEAAFKGLGRALGQAVALDPRQAGRIPSTKGVLAGAAGQETEEPS